MTELLRIEDGEWGVSTRVDHGQSLTLRSGQYKTCCVEFVSGESMLVGAVIGEQKGVTGEAQILGYPLRGLSRSRRRMILQQVGIIPRKLVVPPQSLYDFVALPLQIAGRRASQIDRKAREILADLDLTIFARNRMDQLDPGKLRLGFLAQGLIKAPKLILFESLGDETEAATIVPVLRRYAEHGGAVLELLDNRNQVAQKSRSRETEEPAYASS